MRTPDAKGRIRKAGIGRFNEPKKITNDHFTDICETFDIPLSDQQDLRRWFDNLVKAFADWMRDDRRQPVRGADRDRIKKALKHVRGAADCIDQLGPSGRVALQPLRLDGKHDVEARSLVRPSIRPSIRRATSTYHMEKVSDLLKEIETGLIRTLQALDRQPGARGGRKTNDYLYWLIIYLAKKWAALGKEVSTGPKSDFMAFCELVIMAIGWPPDGLSSAVRLRRFRHNYPR